MQDREFFKSVPLNIHRLSLVLNAFYFPRNIPYNWLTIVADTIKFVYAV